MGKRAQVRRLAKLLGRQPRQEMVAIRVGLASPDLVAATKRELHDALIEANPVRSGPVQWALYNTEDRARLRWVLEKAHRPDAQELMNQAVLHPGSILVVAMVRVPLEHVPPEARR